MKRIILLVLVTMSSLNAFCQTGKLELYLAASDYCDIYGEYILYSEDSLVNKGCYFGEGLFEIDSLNPGAYNVEFYYNDTLLFKRYNLIAKQDTISQYTIGIDTPYFKSKNDSIPDLEFYTSILYGPNIINKNPYVMGSFSYNLGVNFKITEYWRHFSFWFIYGAEYVYTAFNNDTTMYPPSSVKHERYSNFNLNLGFYNRLSFFEKYNNSISESWAFDLGVSYNFPFIFRHMYNVDDRKFVTRRLHQFSNFSVFSRFSYRSVAITGEYRLFDYVKSDFPEVPKLRFGISFIIKE